MSLWLPNWAIDRRGRPGSHSAAHGAAGEPLVLAMTVGNQRLVTAVAPDAAALGILPGMPLTDARALYPGLAVAAADPAGDAAALAQLARWCDRFSPWTAPHGADGLWLDVTGCAHFQGGEENLAHEVVERLSRRGIACRAAIADTAGAAWAMARSHARAIAILPSGEARAALAELPVMALRLDPVTVAALERLGLRRIGALYALPRAALAARFGERVALRLDQALGAVAEPLSPVPPPPSRWSRRRFAEPIGTAEDLAAATRLLLETLCRHLGEEGLGARRLVLTLYRVDGTQEQTAIGTARPSRDPRHLLRLFEERLTLLDLGLGVEDMRLAAPVVEKLAATQLALRQTRPLAGKIPDEATLAELVDRLANRLGLDAVHGLAPQDSHVPERAVRLAPVFSPPGDAQSWQGKPPRPLRLLPRPEPIEAVAPVPDDPPVLFRWRRLAHRLRRADGPERIAGEWWRRGGDGFELRDYYRVEDEAGRRFWLYRAGLYRPTAPPRWFLHGIFA